MMKVAPMMVVLERTVGISNMSMKSQRRKMFKTEIKTLTQV